MVLAQHRTHAAASPLRLDYTRILGMAGAIALNLLAFMLLMVPMSAPPQTAKDDEMPVPVDMFERTPPPPPPPPEVEVKPQTRNTPAPVQQQTPPPQPPVVSETPSEMALPPPEIIVAKVDPPPAVAGRDEPLGDAHQQYESAPAPRYPRESMSAGQQGTVLLRVLVDVDGTPLDVEIKRSSGFARLDNAARQQVLKKWKFRPAIRDGQAIQVYGIVPVTFRLD